MDGDQRFVEFAMTRRGGASVPNVIAEKLAIAEALIDAVDAQRRTLAVSAALSIGDAPHRIALLAAARNELLEWIDTLETALEVSGGIRNVVRADVRA